MPTLAAISRQIKDKKTGINTQNATKLSKKLGFQPQFATLGKG
jgi:hypothetical protein